MGWFWKSKKIYCRIVQAEDQYTDNERKADKKNKIKIQLEFDGQVTKKIG